MVNTYYRPVGNDFLDKCNPGAFWITKEGLKTDFPDTIEIKQYTDDDLDVYCKENDVSPFHITIYS